MAKKKSEKVVKAVSPKFKYLCPACSNVAIETSNKMLGVEVDCQVCGRRIQLDDVKRYIKA